MKVRVFYKGQASTSCKHEDFFCYYFTVGEHGHLKLWKDDVNVQCIIPYGNYYKVEQV